jgi:DNA-3-methyladenine glycosylase I
VAGLAAPLRRRRRRRRRDRPWGAALSTPGRGAETGPDGLTRCPWGPFYRRPAGPPRHRVGHAGARRRGHVRAVLPEAFQSGLSWLTILRKRAAFRAAFANFDLARSPRSGRRTGDRPLTDAASSGTGPRSTPRSPTPGPRSACPTACPRWSGATRRRPPGAGDARRRPRLTPASKALSRELKRSGFTFTGPVTAYAAMQATGVVNDHRKPLRLPRLTPFALTAGEHSPWPIRPLASARRIACC